MSHLSGLCLDFLQPVFCKPKLYKIRIGKPGSPKSGEQSARVRMHGCVYAAFLLLLFVVLDLVVEYIKYSAGYVRTNILFM